MKVYLGIDAGSVSTKFALLAEDGELLHGLYLRTQGRPIDVVQRGLRLVEEAMPDGVTLGGVGTTGSARYLAGVIVGADVIKNEITAHAVGALEIVPDVQTILEIGGQDSKIIMLRDGVVIDFAMNTVCAAGTGSFLDQQASRLNIPITDFGPMAMKSRTPVRIAGRCTVFAESDMIHKQQMGHRVEDILYGLCQALVRNYLNNVGLGKEIMPPVAFQGGVAYNQGIIRAFEEELEMPVVVPPHHEVMGAIGVGLLAQEAMARNGDATKFRGFDVASAAYRTSSFECESCPNRCEVAQVLMGGEVVARWGGRCDLWERVTSS